MSATANQNVPRSIGSQIVAADNRLQQRITELESRIKELEETLSRLTQFCEAIRSSKTTDL